MKCDPWAELTRMNKIETPKIGRQGTEGGCRLPLEEGEFAPRFPKSTMTARCTQRAPNPLMAEKGVRLRLSSGPNQNR